MKRDENCDFGKPELLAPRQLSDPSNPFMISFLSIPKMRNTKAHALVIPRDHLVPGKDELDAHQLVEMGRETNRLRRAMLLGGVAREVLVFQRTAPDIPEGHNGTKMNHWHDHVLGVDSGTTRIDWGPGAFSHPEDDEISKMVELLRDERYGN